jgi:hypothetical protein
LEASEEPTKISELRFAIELNRNFGPGPVREALREIYANFVAKDRPAGGICSESSAGSSFVVLGESADAMPNPSFDELVSVADEFPDVVSDVVP